MRKQFTISGQFIPKKFGMLNIKTDKVQHKFDQDSCLDNQN